MLIDRYYYDFFVDQRRYRLRVPQAIVRLGHFFLKKPDLVVLLDAPAEVLQKPEAGSAARGNRTPARGVSGTSPRSQQWPGG